MAAPAGPNYAMVVPCYNESSRWDAAYWKDLLSIPYVSWVFVDDGSRDSTPRCLEETCEHGPGRVMRLPDNHGKAEAVRAGLRDALAGQSSFLGVGFVDADGSVDGSEILRLLGIFTQHSNDSRGHFDAVWSSRVKMAGRDVRRSATRHYIGRAIATALAIGEDDMPYDTQSGLKIFRPSRVLSAALKHPFRTRWLFDVELLIRWRQLTGEPMAIREEPLERWRDVPGSKLSFASSGTVAREVVLLKLLQIRARSAAKQIETEV